MVDEATARIWIVLPRAIGFWLGWTVALIFLLANKQSLDATATIGLVSCVLIWLLANIALRSIGPALVETNLWAYGCGCLATILGAEISQYLGIIVICAAAIGQGSVSVIQGLPAMLGAVFLWFVVVFLDIT